MNLDCNTYLAYLFLERGADIEAKDNDGRTALMSAAEYVAEDGPDDSENDKLRILLGRRAEVNAVDNKGKTALMHAVERLQDNEDYLEQLKARVTLLIDSGANIGMKDNDGRTVFDLCKSEELKKFIKDAHKQYSSGGIDLKQDPQPQNTTIGTARISNGLGGTFVFRYWFLLKAYEDQKDHLSSIQALLLALIGIDPPFYYKSTAARSI